MITPRRFHRLRQTLQHRQPDLTVILEQVHKGHNLAAILRTCDAVGIPLAHAVPTQRPHRVRLVRSPGSGAGVNKWVKTRRHSSIEDAAEEIRRTMPGVRILAAHLSPRAYSYLEVDWTQPTALLLGQEKDGVTPEGLAIADGEVMIPMHGLVASLNVSVAAAVMLYEARRQREAAGLFAESRLSPDEFRNTLFRWAYPRLAQRCKELGIPYPALGESGELLGELPRGGAAERGEAAEASGE
ncbi:MAG: tRNA (guanosine(18)-2'-O)-methyltransferase TrmH [Acidobacteriota bacterium]